jgi:hypothetical protein
MASLFLYNILLLSAPLFANSARYLRDAGHTKSLSSARGPSASDIRRALIEEQYSDIPIDYTAVSMKFIGAGDSATQPYSDSKESISWSQCLADSPVYLNSVCVLRSKMNDSRFISQLSFGFTDGTYHNIGCGAQGQIQCYW